jgi:hypothetical protein
MILACLHRTADAKATAMQERNHPTRTGLTTRSRVSPKGTYADGFRKA